jgi:hypothetical protein
MRRLPVAFICLLLYLPETVAQTPPPAGSPGVRLAFISDTQKPLFIEALINGTNRNEEATDSLFSSLLRVRPAALFMLGDLVSLGAYPGAWESIDDDIQTLRNAHIPVHGILGNHELMFYARTGEMAFAETFPEHRKTGYCITIDSVAVVLLNSNFDKLDVPELQTQRAWYQRVLDSLTNDPAVSCIAVCCHHSPFTNSKVVEASADVRQRFVPPFLASPKCRVFLSGHAHTFERFKYKEKDFFVIGGGGGSRHALFTGNEQQWQDLSPAKKPLFHYFTLERQEDSLFVTLWGLGGDFSGVAPEYAVRIGYD